MTTDIGRRHLAPVDNDTGELLASADRAQQGAARLQRLVAAALVTSPRPSAPLVRLSAWQRLQVEQTRKLLLDAPELFGTKPAEYVAGLIEGAALNLLDVIDAITDLS